MKGFLFAGILVAIGLILLFNLVVIFPACLASVLGACILPNPLGFLQPVTGLGLIILGIFPLTFSHKAGRHSWIIGGGLVPLFGLLILVIAVMSLVFGILIGHFIFSGVILNNPLYAALPWGSGFLTIDASTVALVLILIGGALYFLGHGNWRGGRK